MPQPISGIQQWLTFKLFAFSKSKQGISPIGVAEHVDVMKSYERKCGFYVRAHMLRHTYGTYTLLALRKSKEFEGEPLLYVRDRLGHSDVQTTMIYLHLINQLEAQSVLAHEDEIDMMFMTDSVSRI